MIHIIHTPSYMPPLKVSGKDLTYTKGLQCGGYSLWGFNCPHCKSHVQIPESVMGLPDWSDPHRWLGECPHCGGMLEIETHEL